MKTARNRSYPNETSDRDLASRACSKDSGLFRAKDTQVRFCMHRKSTVLSVLVHESSGSDLAVTRCAVSHLKRHARQLGQISLVSRTDDTCVHTTPLGFSFSDLERSAAAIWRIPRRGGQGMGGRPRFLSFSSTPNIPNNDAVCIIRQGLGPRQHPVTSQPRTAIGYPPSAGLLVASREVRPLFAAAGNCRT